MNRNTVRVVLVVFAFLTVEVAFSVVASQTPDLDPAKLAPHIYQIELENEHVRVLRVTARPRETPPLHWHPDRVLVYLNQCSGLLPAEDGGMRRVTFKAGAISWEPAVTHGGEPSTVVNDCHIVEIELK